jgi:hypothetical protein
MAPYGITASGAACGTFSVPTGAHHSSPYVGPSPAETGFPSHGGPNWAPAGAENAIAATTSPSAIKTYILVDRLTAPANGNTPFIRGARRRSRRAPSDNGSAGPLTSPGPSVESGDSATRGRALQGQPPRRMLTYVRFMFGPFRGDRSFRGAARSELSERSSDGRRRATRVLGVVGAEVFRGKHGPVHSSDSGERPPAFGFRGASTTRRSQRSASCCRTPIASPTSPTMGSPEAMFPSSGAGCPGRRLPASGRRIVRGAELCSTWRVSCAAG